MGSSKDRHRVEVQNLERDFGEVRVIDLEARYASCVRDLLGLISELDQDYTIGVIALIVIGWASYWIKHPWAAFATSAAVATLTSIVIASRKFYGEHSIAASSDDIGTKSKSSGESPELERRDRPELFRGSPTGTHDLQVPPRAESEGGRTDRKDGRRRKNASPPLKDC